MTKFLDGRRVAYEDVDDQTVVFTFDVGAGPYEMLVLADEKIGILACYAYGPQLVNEWARTAAQEFFTRVNRQMNFGGFVLDLDTGEFMYKTNVMADDGHSPSQAGVEFAMNVAVSEMSHWRPGLDAIFNDGVMPSLAIARIMQSR